MKVADLAGHKVMIAVSGGLDSCTITHWLKEKGIEVIAYTADLGQPDEADIEDVRQRMLACGASEMIVGDLKNSVSSAGVQLIQSLARYEGGYWNTTGIARHVVVADMVPLMQERGISILSHGATGRGNDQVRFQLAAQMLATNIDVYAPWREDEFLQVFGGRKEMIDYCDTHSLPITATHDKPYSTDANLLGLTHEAGELEALTTPANRIIPGMGVFPSDAPNEPELYTVEFIEGIPAQINGQRTSEYSSIVTSNTIGGRHGIGIGLHAVENRFVGIKSRGIYEAPGLELLGICYEYLLQLILDRRARRIFDPISNYIAEQIYQGYWFDTATQACWKYIEHINQLATGEITVSLYKGQASFHSAKNVKHSLYSENTASMEDVGDFDHRDSEGFLGVLGLSAKALNKSGQSGL